MTTEDKLVVGGNGLLSSEFSVSAVIDRIQQEVEDGNVDGANLGVVFKRVEKIIEAAKKNDVIKSQIENDTNKHMNNRTAVIFGTKIQETTTKTLYDYSNCNHTEYNSLIEIQELITNRIKEIEKELQDMAKAKVSKNKNLLNLSDGSKEVLIQHTYEIRPIECGEIAKVLPPKVVKIEGLKYFVQK